MNQLESTAIIQGEEMHSPTSEKDKPMHGIVGDEFPERKCIVWPRQAKNVLMIRGLANPFSSCEGSRIPHYVRPNGAVLWWSLWVYAIGIERKRLIMCKDGHCNSRPQNSRLHAQLWQVISIVCLRKSSSHLVYSHVLFVESKRLYIAGIITMRC